MSTIENYADLEKSEDIVPTDVIENQKLKCRLYPRRWFILTLLVLYSMSNAMQWIQYSIISDVITKYYGVSSFLVDWTSMIYMVTYIPSIFVGSWLLNKLGIRLCVLLGAGGTCIGAWVKVLSVAHDKFFLTFIGQTIVAISQTFEFSLPARVAAVWFDRNEVTLAISFAVWGNQFGIALGFLIPPTLVRCCDTVGGGLRLIYYFIAVMTTIILLLVVIFFKDKPDLPPSPAQAAQKSSDHTQNDFVGSIRKILMEKIYVFLILSYGINVGLFYAILILLNQFRLNYLPTEQEAGPIGYFMIIVGIVGSIYYARLVDNTGAFREITLVILVFCYVIMINCSFIVQRCRGAIYVVCFTGFFGGFCMSSYLHAGFDFASKLPYPELKGTLISLMNACAQVYGIIFTIYYGWLITLVNAQWASICLYLTVVTGASMTGLIRPRITTIILAG